MSNFTFQLKEFKKIVKQTDLAKREGKKLVYVMNRTLIAFNSYFLLKFRLDDSTSCPKDGLHYLSRLSLSSDPIEDVDSESYWKQNLNLHLNKINWGSVNSIPVNHWEDFDNCRLTASGNNLEFIHHRQIVVFQDRDRRVIQLAGLGEFSIYYDPKSTDPWEFIDSNILRLSPSIELNLGRGCFYRNENITARISTDDQYVQFNSPTISVILPSIATKVNISYHGLLGLMPRFDCLSSDVKWMYDDRAYIYEYNPDGYCYVIERDYEVVDSWQYARGREICLPEPMYLSADKLHSFVYRGLTLALNIEEDCVNRKHALLMRSRIYKPPTIALKPYKQDERVNCLHYDTRILGCISQKFVSRQMKKKIEESKDLFSNKATDR